MAVGRKLLWGGLGWVLGGPIGGIIGYAMASLSEGQMSTQADPYRKSRRYPKTRSGDFIVTVLVLLASVMKADKKLLRAELDYVKKFLLNQFPRQDVNEFMILFKDIIKQEYPLRDVCRQIQRSMDHPSRLELIHVLFGLSQADGNIHITEINIIQSIARYLNINENDFQSIKAMFIKDNKTSYKILEIDPSAADTEIKRAYRRMANKYHPDKVSHLGPDLINLAEEKFKSVNDAYQSIKKERGIN